MAYRKESGRKLRIKNLKKDPEDMRDHVYKSQIKEHRKMKTFLTTLPNKIDHTSEMSPVKDQGFLGSCVGFSVCAMKEWQEQKEHAAEVKMGKKDHRDEKYYDLSEAWIYWMSKKIDAWPGQEGTSIRYAMKVLNKIGAPSEKAWPYDDFNYGEPKKWAALVARWSLVGEYSRIEGLNELKGALVQAPVCIGIGCYEEIDSVGSDGIVPYPKNSQFCYGGHAICCVGYDDSRELVKFKNSWSSGWGERGYGYLPYIYIRDFMWDAWTCRDLRVTKEMLKGSASLLD